MPEDGDVSILDSFDFCVWTGRGRLIQENLNLFLKENYFRDNLLPNSR